MKFLKKILLFLFALLVLTYLGFAVTRLNEKPTSVRCKAMTFSVVDSVDYGFINRSEIETLLRGGGLYPVGSERRDINVRRIEQLLQHHPFIKKAECYLTSGNELQIDIHQRVPVLHIMNDNGNEYYMDDKGEIMNIPDKAVDVVVVTGNFNKAYARKNLLLLGQFLEKEPFWNAQIEQIHVTGEGELQVVPRVGEQILLLGKPEQLEEKFSKLFQFYLQGLNEVGWNKYDTINIEFVNQIICTKKQTKI